MDHINQDMKASEKSIRRMEMCCGYAGFLPRQAGVLPRACLCDHLHLSPTFAATAPDAPAAPYSSRCAVLLVLRPQRRLRAAMFRHAGLADRPLSGRALLISLFSQVHRMLLLQSKEPGQDCRKQGSLWQERSKSWRRRRREWSPCSFVPGTQKGIAGTQLLCHHRTAISSSMLGQNSYVDRVDSHCLCVRPGY